MDGTFTQARMPWFIFAFAFFSSFALVACDGAGITQESLSLNEPSIGANDGKNHIVRDDSEAIGFYTKGSLEGSVAIPDESTAYLKIFRLRDRGWGTFSLVDAIIGASSAFRSKYPTGDRVSIGDLSREGGGTISRHTSHQNGLDADIAYLRINHEERDPDVWGDEGFEESFVLNGNITSNFDHTRNWFFIKELVARGNVQRIFVDPAIKRYFCERSIFIDPSADAKDRMETLRRLRPYPNHADHLHMRVRCPKSSARCLPQEEVPVGSGCSNIDLVRSSIAEHDHTPDFDYDPNEL